MADADLAAQAATGDADAFARIMRRHNRLLFRTARSLLKSDAEAEDALQDAYLRAWRAIGRFRADARLSTWLVRIVINEALGRLRRDGPRREAQVLPFAAAIDPDGPPMEDVMDGVLERTTEGHGNDLPDRVALRAEVRRLMEAAIDALPEAFRTVFVLRAVEELSVEEVAAALGVPDATVRTRFFRARGLLRERLARDMDMALADAFAFDGARCDRIVAAVLARLDEAPHTPRP
jgi:RNA polymerase sigma-70 factor (ECF subfamily)